MIRIPHRDSWIETPRGRLFARTWSAHPHCTLPPDEVPVILLHDSLGSVELWRSFPLHLAAATGRSVIAYDRLGFGKSDPHAGPIPLDFIAAEAREYFPQLRAQLGFDRFVAMGHSVGGVMAIHCAGALPDACIALVSESAQSFVEERTLQGIRDAKAGFQRAGQMERLVKYHGAKAQWVLDSWTESWLSPAFRDWNLDAVLPRVRCPVLVLHGEHDEYGSVAQPKRIGELAGAGAKVEILNGCRHVPHREAEAPVLERVKQFLS